MTEFARLDIKEIRADVPRANFTEAKIEQIADLILASGGVIRPLVVKQVDIDSYELVGGALEYYAAVRAREKDPRRGELVNAFVVSKKNDEAVKHQLALFNENAGQVGQAPPPTSTSPDQLSAFVTNFVVSAETRINEMREQMVQNKRNFESEIKRLDKLVEREKRPSDLLDMVNTLDMDELKAKLAFHGADKTKIAAICAAKQQKANGHFDTYQELLKAAKGLGERGLLNLLDRVRTYSR